MTRTNDKPEPPHEPVAMLAEYAARSSSSFGKTQPLDPPPRAARLGAASGVEGPTAASGEERADESERSFDIARDERRFDTKHAIAGALERRITARVSARAPDVIRAIDLNHETLCGSQEICDEAAQQRYLPTKDRS